MVICVMLSRKGAAAELSSTKQELICLWSSGNVCPQSLAPSVLPHVQVMDRMKSTLFCLVLPGDSASARRTSEIFMAGCIPVFLGPPYGSMPLAEEGGIDYKASSLFFNVTEYRCSFLDFSIDVRSVIVGFGLCSALSYIDLPLPWTFSQDHQKCALKTSHAALLEARNPLKSEQYEEWQDWVTKRTGTDGNRPCSHVQGLD